MTWIIRLDHPRPAPVKSLREILLEQAPDMTEAEIREHAGFVYETLARYPRLDIGTYKVNPETHRTEMG